MGGRVPTQEFFRLFMIPGMNHCGGGVGAYAIDYLSYLEAWVEQGRVPSSLLGGHLSDAYLKSLPEGSQLPVVNVADGSTKPPSSPITFTRPVYPYPVYAKYGGEGDSNDGRNFVPAK
jgi:feruloyl esterase